MKNITEIILLVGILFLIGFPNKGQAEDNRPAPQTLIQRILPDYAFHFIIEVAPTGDVDWFELASKGDKIVLRGNNGVSIEPLRKKLKYVPSASHKRLISQLRCYATVFGLSCSSLFGYYLNPVSGITNTTRTLSDNLFLVGFHTIRRRQQQHIRWACSK